MGEALAVFFVYETVRGSDAWTRAETVEPRGNRAPVVAVATALVLAFVTFSGIAINVEFGFYPSGARLVSRRGAQPARRKRVEPRERSPGVSPRARPRDRS